MSEMGDITPTAKKGAFRPPYSESKVFLPLCPISIYFVTLTVPLVIVNTVWQPPPPRPPLHR